jgi:hypothetical protein
MSTNKRAAKPAGMRSILEAPETNVALFAFLLNFPWEMWQIRFFQGTAMAPAWDVIRTCSRATVGDAAIAVVSFLVVAGLARSRAWILRPSAWEVAGFVATGVLITIGIEWLSTGPLDRWAYAEAMPTLPLLGTGVLPLLQWILIPPLVAWFVRRQLT